MSREDEIREMSDEEWRELQDQAKFLIEMLSIEKAVNRASLVISLVSQVEISRSEVARLRRENEELRSKVADLENDIECARLGFP